MKRCLQRIVLTLGLIICKKYVVVTGSVGMKNIYKTE